MMIYVTILLLVPFVAALGYRYIPHALSATLLVYTALLGMAYSAVKLFLSFDTPYAIELFEGYDSVVLLFDSVLLGYFLYVGYVFRHKWVLLFSIVQIALFIAVELVLPHEASSALLVTQSSVWMMIIVNIVGALIIWYAVRYMTYEKSSDTDKKLFISFLVAFLGVMNFLVVANELMLFFLLFELTALASYELIRFRGDKESQNNALLALWINQIGGIALLGALFISAHFLQLHHFDTLLKSAPSSMLYLAVALVLIAALIKAATVPFHRWLLGAMIAPTPVSAMLHAATMVKVAPFMVIKVAPVIAATVLGDLFMTLVALSFLFASFMALKQSHIKALFGYSTIALLALMMYLAAFGTPQAIQAALFLMLFHALAKAVLFLVAGIMEQKVHIKVLEDMYGMFTRLPIAMVLAVFAFMSLTMPPFGAFWGKFEAIVLTAQSLHTHPLLLFALIALLGASVVLVLAYFKLLSLMLSQSATLKRTKVEFSFLAPVLVLVSMSITASMALLQFVQISSMTWVVLALLVLLAVAVMLITFSFDRTVVYHSGEKGYARYTQHFYSLPYEIERFFTILLGVLFVLLLGVAGVVL